jgi:transcriptional regulator GlxA family with amidase domain
MVAFGIYLYDSVEVIDVGGTFGVLSMARRVFPSIEVVTIAEKAGPVTLANGLVVLAEFGFDDCPPVDVMLITGGAAWPEQSRNPAVLGMLRNQPPDCLVASVCTGGMILAASGLLEGKRATTRRLPVGGERLAPLGILAESYPGVRAVSSAVVDEGAVVTGGGVSLAIDTTLHVIGRMLGEQAAEEVARIIEYTRARDANLRYFSQA